MSRRGSKRRSAYVDEDSEVENADVNEEDDEDDEDSFKGASAAALTLSSQAPVSTQEIISVKDSEQRNLMNLTEEQREKAVMDLSRLVLFKALAGEAIDRAKCVKEAGITDRISSAAFKEVDERLRNCFGFELTRVPEWIGKWKSVSKTMKERYYVINKLHDDDGTHARALHAVNGPAQRGFLMAVLAFCYCKGASRGDGSRWISDRDLYALLHRLDDSMPGRPPVPGVKRRAPSSRRDDSTLDPDSLIHLLVQRDYLLKEKGVSNEVEFMMYSMGPRSVLEVGNEQILTFCAEILDEEVDPVMLKEIEAIEHVDGEK